MVSGAVAGNIPPDATSPTGNIFAEAMRGARAGARWRRAQFRAIQQLEVFPKDVNADERDIASPTAVPHLRGTPRRAGGGGHAIQQRTTETERQY